MTTRRIVRVAVLVSLAICLLSEVALAQTSPSLMLDQYRAVRISWLTTAAGYANRLFGILALIEFAWTAAILVLEKTDLQGWTAALIRKMMFIGAFFALLSFGADWIPRIINSFQIIGQNASGLPSLAPTDVLVRGLNITGNLLLGAASSGWMGNFGSALALVFAALLAFLAFLGLTVQLVVTLVESYLVVGAGFIFLGFGGSRWTAPYVERYISLAVSTGVKVMVLYLLLGAGLTLSDGWIAAAAAVPYGPEPAVDALDIAASSVLLLMICWNAPKFTAGILGGTPAFIGGDAVGTVGGLAQGALLAGAAAAGGVALGAKMFAAKGSMSAGQAAGMGAGGAAASGGGGGAAGGAAAGGAAPQPSSGGGGGAPSAGGSGGQVSPPTASSSNGSNGGGAVEQASSSSSSPPPPEKSPSPPPPAAAKPSRSSKVAERGKKVARGLAATTAFVRATQGAVPSDHAPQVAPPPLNTSSESE